MHTRILLTITALSLLTTSWAQGPTPLTQKTPATIVVTGELALPTAPDELAAPLHSEERVSSTTIKIRSHSAIPNPEPLWVVDGIIVDKQDLEDILPEEIEAIEVIRNQAAAAIYGSRGANGVIIVKTRQTVPESEVEVLPWQDPTWYRQQDQLFFRLDEREKILKVAVMDIKGATHHEQVGYDAKKGVLLEDIPYNEPLILLVTTARGRKTWRMQWSDE
ncbi:MAG TPA: hypothetical protein DCE41_35465 [Cytophagales bacterium]|nr:hypothetical protein [Cytophagales bacterium]HAA17279.1 hypothetical protein [Cytophagales bacterium]